MFSYINFVPGLQAVSLLSDQRQQSAALMRTKAAKRLCIAHSEFSFSHYGPILSSNSINNSVVTLWLMQRLSRSSTVID